MATKFRKKAVLTQGNAGATDAELTIANDSTSPMRIDFLSVGKDDYAASRTLTAELRSGSTPIGRLLSGAGFGIDNYFLPIIPRKRKDGIPINGTNLTADGTVRANTAGKVLMVTSLTLVLTNSSVVGIGRAALLDGAGGTPLLSGVVPAAVTATVNPVGTAKIDFDPPVPVRTSIYLDVLAGTLVAEVTGAGYEEDADSLDLQPGFLLYPGDKIYLKAAQLAQNETLTVWVRGEGDDLNIANASGAGVTLATTTA